jgi:hypothetical protein
VLKGSTILGHKRIWRRLIEFVRRFAMGKFWKKGLDIRKLHISLVRNDSMGSLIEKGNLPRDILRFLPKKKIGIRFDILGRMAFFTLRIDKFFLNIDWV